MPLSEIGREILQADSPTLPSLTLELEPGVPQRVELVAFRRLSPDEGLFNGHLAGDTTSTVILTYVGNAEAGIVHQPTQGRAYNIRTTEDGVQHIQLMDLSRAPECALCRPSPSSAPSPL